MTNPFLFGHITVSRYNIGVLWTIPIEWYVITSISLIHAHKIRAGSMITFVTVLGIARTKTWVKLSVLFLLYYRSHQLVHWEWAAFFSGIFLAELSFIWARPLDQPNLSTIRCDEEKETSKGREKSCRTLAYNSFFVFLFVLGIFLGAQPKDSWHKTPGYRWMFEHLPPSYANHTSARATFWPSIGAIFLILSLEMAPFLQSIFTTSFAQYLGEISFSLYMIHCQVQFTLGGWLVPRCMELTGGWENGQSGFLGGIALSLLVLTPITFWVADVFSRLVDERCVRLARWVSTRCFVKL
jgi:peptidoglycan/LPS O-acetylase OafA/YrhL